MGVYHLFPIISAVSGAGLIIVTKFLLSKRNLSLRDYIPFLFLSIFFIMLPFTTFRFWGYISGLEPKIIFLFFIVILIALTWNIFYYRAIKLMSVQEFELIDLFAPIFTTLLAVLVYQSERALTPLLWGGLAFLSLILFHIRRHHLVFPTQVRILFLVIFLISLEAILWKPLLQVFPPFLFYFFRCGVIASFFTLSWRPSYHRLKKHGALFLILLSGFLAVVHMVSRMYGFESVGIVSTMVAYALTPVLVFVFDIVFLKERLKPRLAIAAFLITTFVILAQF